MGCLCVARSLGLGWSSTGGRAFSYLYMRALENKNTNELNFDRKAEFPLHLAPTLLLPFTSTIASSHTRTARPIDAHGRARAVLAG